MDHSLIVIRIATPSLPFPYIVVPTGHSIRLPTARPRARHAGSIAAKWAVKALVVPLLF
jgi:hypothetical protein